MKYIPAHEQIHFGDWFFWVMVAFAIVTVPTFITINQLQRKEENRNLPAAIMASLIIAVLALFTGFSIRGMDRTGNESRLDYWKGSSIRGEVLDTYGLNLTPKEIDKLRYPREKPTVSEKTFGTLERNVDAYGVREKQEVTLLWRDGKMILAQKGKDGRLSEISPLPAKYQPQTEPRDLVRPLYAPEADQ